MAAKAGTAKQSETKLKRLLRGAVGGWSEAYEPSRGSGVGYADLQFLVDGEILPVEVKCGHIADGRLFSSQIRPSQIAWHHGLRVCGGASFVVVCWLESKGLHAWSIPSVDRGVSARWLEGWELNQCHNWVKDGELRINLSSLVRATKMPQRI